LGTGVKKRNLGGKIRKKKDCNRCAEKARVGTVKKMFATKGPKEEKNPKGKN